MRNFFYTEGPSDKRGKNKCITVYEIRKGQPVRIGSTDHQSAAWYGARYQAQLIIHEKCKIPLGKSHHGCPDLKGLLSFGEMYDRHTGPGLRLFSI